MRLSFVITLKIYSPALSSETSIELILLVNLKLSTLLPAMSNTLITD